MELVQLGRSGVEVPVIGFGTSRYEGGAELPRRAIELGATLIDTAESYGSEELVGRASDGLRERVFVATKASPHHFRASDLHDALDHSLRRLGTNYVDLYQLHRPNPEVPIGETMGALEDAVDAGKVRFIGVSNFSRRQLEEAQRSLTRHRVVSNQVPYSLIDRAIEAELLPYCRETGVTVIAHSPLGQGLENLHRRDRRGALDDVSAETGHSAAQIALTGASPTRAWSRFRRRAPFRTPRRTARPPAGGSRRHRSPHSSQACVSGDGVRRRRSRCAGSRGRFCREAGCDVGRRARPSRRLAARWPCRHLPSR